MALFRLKGLNLRRWQLFKAHRRATGPCGSSSSCSSFRCSRPSSRTTARSSLLQGRAAVPSIVDYLNRSSGFLPVRITAIPVNQDEIQANGWMIWPVIATPTIPSTRAAGAGAVTAGVPAHGGRACAKYTLVRKIQLCLRQLELAGHGRPGPRRGGAADLWLPHLGGVRADPHDTVFDHRCRAGAVQGYIGGGRTCCSSGSSTSGHRCRHSIS